jgi:hypothetical protein
MLRQHLEFSIHQILNFSAATKSHPSFALLERSNFIPVHLLRQIKSNTKHHRSLSAIDAAKLAPVLS